jgi:2-oxoglutarate dehydrogenase E1 component
MSQFDQSTPFFASNSTFIEELYERYLQNPTAVDISWREFFKDATNGVKASQRGASWAAVKSKVIGAQEETLTPKKDGKDKKGAAVSTEEIEKFAHDSIRAIMMVRAYRVRGHLIANLDPLGIEVNDYHAELDPTTYGFSDSDMDKEIFLDGSLGIRRAKLRDIIAILRETYCGSIGVEFMHIMDPEQKAWIQKRIENDRGTHYSAEEKKNIWNTMVEIESFEQFLQVKYPSTKRFSVQGGDTLLPGLDAIINTSSSLGVKEIIFGMPHRGRMNVLTNTLHKPYAELLSIFHGNMDFPEWVTSSGDVKYHLGASADRETPSGKIHMSLLANPSHLEAVDPVVVGKVRAKMDITNDTEKSTVMGVMMHGDAAFAGQGLVSETLALSELRGYRTGGSLHIIVNNQIGFTTAPKYSRFTPYPTDVAKAVQAPIFHANSDDPEAVVYVCTLAAEFRQQFKRDAVVDIICYRKYGHNESDEPMFTQPIMYREIAKKPLPATLYSNRLVAEGVVSEAEVEAKFAEFKAFFEKQYDVAKNFKPNKADWLEGQWTGFVKPEEGAHPDGDTGVDLKKLKEVGLGFAKNPEQIKVNSKIVRQLEAKTKMMESGEGIDWATGEALAFGTLLKEGHPVRLSGQDSGRGTFSQRHSVLVDQETEERYIPLNNLGGKQANYEVIDSSLSEFAILGFEYGYSLAQPNGLTLWEAQFGDFANGAQVIIDQFISSAEIKWLRMSGLVMLLPHGYEGQGPEHSSARLERYLQLCAEDNMIVANCTTPANYFHILRRQLKRNFRKPLVMMTPKSLLRHKLAVSKLSDMDKNTHFKKVIGEVDALKDDKVQRVVITSGKVYYDLYEARQTGKIDNVAIIRMEQYYPFPAKELKAELAKYKGAEVVWCQEEPKNMGPWTFVSPLLEELLESMDRNERVKYAGRKSAASPAAGYLKIHEKEQKALVADALTIPAAAPAKKVAKG